MSSKAIKDDTTWWILKQIPSYDPSSSMDYPLLQVEKGEMRLNKFWWCLLYEWFDDIYIFLLKIFFPGFSTFYECIDSKKNINIKCMMRLGLDERRSRS